MTRAMLLGPTILLIVLAAGGGQPCLGDPPPVIDLQPAQAAPFRPSPLPHVADYWNSGCLRDWPCDEDEIQLIAEGDTLHVLHGNATYNCCPDDIVISVSIEENVLRFTEEEILTLPCDCMCCYDVGATVVDLASGTYTVEFCWLDYETGQIACYVDEIVIPGDAGPLRDDPPAPDTPDAITLADAGQASPAAPRPAGSPRVGECVSSGCLDDPNDPWWPPCGDDEIELSVAGDVLYVVHRNATYNCCRDEIVITASLEGNLLTLTEEEIVPNPCYCLCCYNVAATVIDLAPGTYTVEFCWYDYDTNQIECYVDEIVIPGDGRLPERSDPPVVVGPDAVVDLDPAADSEAIAGLRRPHIGDYFNSGCLEEPWGLPCGDDEIELAVEGHTLYVQHRNATYNCCLDDIVISLSQEGNLLRLTEEEIVPEPCWCICCFNVDASVVDLASGEYVVEFCWFDYETSEIQCYVEGIVVP
jgi:hypothetical protein